MYPRPRPGARNRGTLKRAHFARLTSFPFAQRSMSCNCRPKQKPGETRKRVTPNKSMAGAVGGFACYGTGTGASVTRLRTLQDAG